MKRALLVTCACLVASSWAACSKETPLTQIVVAVDSDWDGFVRAEIDIEGFEKTTTVRADLSNARPRHVALVHDGGPLGPMAITVRAYVAGADEPSLVEPRTNIYFVKDETRLLRIDLLLHCIEQKCSADQACIAGGNGPKCVDSDEPGTLTDWNGDIGAIKTKYHIKDGAVLPGDGGSGGAPGSDSGTDGGGVSGSGGHGSGGHGGAGHDAGGGGDSGSLNDAGDSGPIIDPDSGTPHTTTFKYTPSNIDPEASAIAGLKTVTLNCPDPTFDSTDLSFSGWCGDRPTATVVQQDASHDAAVLVMGPLTVGSPATLHLTGDKPIILLVFGAANIDGVIDASAQGATPGPGADRDCTVGRGATGTNGSGLNIASDGGGGGGFGSAGGTGAPSNGLSNVNAAGGTEGNLTLVPLRGGCSGGDSGEKNGGSSSAAHGAGGGAVQISASDRLNISGAVIAVGGGGRAGSESQTGGAGGGSGGAILLEGASVALGAGAVISVNGGGGGAGQPYNDTSSSSGEDGHAATSVAAGGPMNSIGGAGGPGAWRDADAGNGAKPGNALGVYGGGGGGGGGVGRIRINNAPNCLPAGMFTPRPAVTCKSCGTCADPAPLGCTSATNDGIAYAVCSTGVAWTTARDRCIAIGMHLARIDDADENTWLATKISGNTWIGGDDMVEDDWVWVDNNSQFWNGDENGSVVTYAAWLSGEPNDSPAPQDCATIGTDAKWRDFNCTSDLLPYACEHVP